MNICRRKVLRAPHPENGKSAQVGVPDPIQEGQVPPLTYDSCWPPRGPSSSTLSGAGFRSILVILIAVALPRNAEERVHRMKCAPVQIQGGTMLCFCKERLPHCAHRRVDLVWVSVGMILP